MMAGGNPGNRSDFEAMYSQTRRKLDDAGYMESFGLDSLRLVDHIFGDLEKTTESFQKTLIEYSHYKKVAEELECGVAPFKEENIRLLKENSQLRIGLAKALEEAEDRARDPTLRLRELEAENNDLKLLVTKFAERIKRLEVELLEKSKRIIKLQERELSPTFLVKGDVKRKPLFGPHHNPSMEVDRFVADACPQCVRLRNYVEYGKNKERNPQVFDYMKLADSRIEALQLQLRSVKNLEKEHLSLIASLKSRVGTRDSEIDKLRELIKIRPGRDNKVNGALTYCKGDNMDYGMELKSADIQLKILQRRNMELEEKLKKSILQEHQDFMLRKTSSCYGEDNVARKFLEKELDKYPSHDQMTLLEKLYYLERQLSHCCKEKAVLKNKIEEFNDRHVKSESASASQSTTTTGKRQVHGTTRIASNKQPNRFRPFKATKVTEPKETSKIRKPRITSIRPCVEGNSSDDESMGDNEIMHDDQNELNASLSEVSDTEDIENYENNKDEDTGSDKFGSQVVPAGMAPSNQKDCSKKSSKTTFESPKRGGEPFKHQIFSGSTRSSNLDRKHHSKKAMMNYDDGNNERDVDSMQVIKPPTTKHPTRISPVPNEHSNSEDDMNANQVLRHFDDTTRPKGAQQKLKTPSRQIAARPPSDVDNQVSQKASKNIRVPVPSNPIKDGIGPSKATDKFVKNVHRSNMQKNLGKVGTGVVVRNKVSTKSMDNKQTRNPKFIRTTVPNRKQLENQETQEDEDLLEDEQNEQDMEEVGSVRTTDHSKYVANSDVGDVITLRTGDQTKGKKTSTFASDERELKANEYFRTKQKHHESKPNTSKAKSPEKAKPEVLNRISGFAPANASKRDMKVGNENELDDSATGYYDDDDEFDENKSSIENDDFSDANANVISSPKKVANLNESIVVTHPSSVTLKDKTRRTSKEPVTAMGYDPKLILAASSSHGLVKSHPHPSHPSAKQYFSKESNHEDDSRRDVPNSNLGLTGKADVKENIGLTDSRSHTSNFGRKDVDRTRKGNERKKGISAIREPSLLSISEYEKDRSDDFDELGPLEGRTRKSDFPPESSVASTRQNNPYNQSQLGSDPFLDSTERDIPSSHSRGLKQDAMRNTSIEGPANSQSSLKHGLQSFKHGDTGNPFTDQQHFQDSRRGFTEREYGRGLDDPVVPYGDSSLSSYTRKMDDDNSGFPRHMQRRVPEKSSSGQFDNEYYKPDDKTSNPYMENFHKERQSIGTNNVGVNTDFQPHLPWEAGRENSLEKKALMDKISALESKLDSVHTECSQHQLKSFEVQGELERTKHMLQVEKQERDLAVSELKRVRELNSESTARMLMSSALGSDGSFRRGITPMEMEREIINMRTALASLDRDKDEMRVELDRKDERIARLSNDVSKYVEELSQLKLRLKNSELQLNHTGESAKEQTREVEFLKKQLESNRRDLENTVRERDEALKDLHKLSGVHSKGQMERRNIVSELELKNKEADDLRRQVQRYIDEVRRIEELLLDKEEEMEMLIQHYRSLTVENNNLEAQRTSLEREASSIRDSVRESVEQNISFKTQLASQNSLVQSLEQEIQNLTQQISQLENQVSSKSEKEKMLETEAKASKDLMYRLEIQMDKLKLEMADTDSKRKQLEAENTELTAHISSLEARLNDETERQQQLEDLVANSREKDFQMERTNLGISRERNDLVEQLTCLQQRSENLNSEVSRYRLKSIELQNDLDRARRQLENEKRERETAILELKRVREQLSSSSANYLLNTALATSGSTGGNLTDSSIRNVTASSTAGTTFRQNMLGTDVQRTSSREQSPFSMPQDLLSPRLQLDPPMASSTSRNDEQYTSSTGTEHMRNKKEVKQTDDDDFEEWDSPTK